MLRSSARTSRALPVLLALLGVAWFLPTLSAASPDTDQDGRSDEEEQREGTNPRDPASARPARLAWWRFEAPGWRTEAGQEPSLTNGVGRAPFFGGQAAAFIGVTNRPALRFPLVDVEGQLLLSPRSGSIRFLFRPAWATRDERAAPGYSWGTGPTHPACLFQVTTGAEAASRAVMGLWLDANGTNLSFVTTSADGTARTNLQTRISWLAPQVSPRRQPNLTWHEMIVTWSPAATTFVLDGNLLQDPVSKGWSGPPLAFADARNAVLTLGNRLAGDSPAEGYLDEVETFNFPATPLESHVHLARSALSASFNAAPAAVTLRWYNATGAGQTIRRRAPGTTNWTTLATNVVATSYIDQGAAIKIGEVLEYEVGDRSLLVGLNAAPIERRGRVLLLVDETQAEPLAIALRQLQQDLVGDGWTVIQRTAPRHEDRAWANQAINPSYIAAIERTKSLVLETHRADSAGLRALILIGHVVVPYSGGGAEDGHREHTGAWPADSYYGDLDERWTDTTLNNAATVADPRLRNVPGDGKFDAYLFGSRIRPGDTNRLNGMEVAVGRIDFANLAAFAPLTETDLLRRYFDKDHRYRFGELTFEVPAAIGGYFFGPFGGESRDIYDNAASILSRSLGLPLPVAMHADCFATPASTLWGLQGGFGTPDTLNNNPDSNRALGISAHTTASLARADRPPRTGFFLLKGSYFGNWNQMPNNLQRATLAGIDHGLASFWVRDFTWHFDGLAIGETLGDGLVQTTRGDVTTRAAYILGDPTLRTPVLAAPTQGTGQRRNGVVTLNWNPPADNAASFQVYRSSNALEAPFVPLGAPVGPATSFADSAPPPGPLVYQVRALKLTVTGSGAFTNLSQAAFITVN